MTDRQLLLLAGAAGALGVWWIWRQGSGGAMVDPYAYGLQGSPGAPVAVNYGGSMPVSGPGTMIDVSTYGDAHTGSVLTKAGIGVGTSAGTAAVLGGSALIGAATAGIGAAVGLLTWAISSKGLFRGGEIGVIVNPLRDQYLLMFGPGGTDPTSGFGKLAAALTELTGEPDGSHYFKALIGAETKEELVAATQDIQQVFARVGINIPALTL